jgi:hypothetical protein
LHRVVPGAHTPPHVLVVALHKNGQGRLVHSPSDPHVRSALPMHSDVPGTQTPPHLPVFGSHTFAHVC